MKDSTIADIPAVIILVILVFILLPLGQYIHIDPIPDIFGLAVLAWICMTIVFLLHPRVRHFTRAYMKMYNEWVQTYRYEKEVD